MPQPIKVFISYAREDADFVDRLTKVLGSLDIEYWIDRREITPAADWLRRIVDGIVNATFFIAVISPDWIASEVCAVELQQAVGLNKPLVPVLWRSAALPKPLDSVQWCDFSDPDSFDGSIMILEAVLRRDPEWLALHASLAGSAADWDARGQHWYSLLQGSEIKVAERWLNEANDKRPKPTTLQIDYVRASRRFSRHWKLSATGIVATLLAITSATFVLRHRSFLEAQARDLATRAVQLRSSDQAELVPSTLMLVEAVRELEDLGLRSPDIEAMLRSGSGMLLRPLAAGRHPGGIGGMASAPDGKLVATFAFGLNADVSAEFSGRTDNTVRIWKVPSSTPSAVLQHDAPVSAAAFDVQSRLVAGTIKGAIEFWDLRQIQPNGGVPFAKYDQGGVITSISGSNSEEVVVTANSSGMLCLWETTTGRQRWCRKAASHEGSLVAALSPDCNWVASGDEQGLVRVWTAKNGKPQHSLQHTSKGTITALVFSPGSNQIASGDDKGEMHVWSVDDGADKFAFLHRDAVRGIAYTSREAKSSFIATVSVDGSLRTIDPRAFGPWKITELKGDYALWHVALDPGGQLAAVARGDGFVDVWSCAEARVVGRLRIASRDVATGLVFLPGNVLAVVDGGEGMQFVESTAGRDSSFLNSTEGIDQMALSESGFLLGSNFAGVGYAWDLSGTTAERKPFPWQSFTLAAFNHDGDRAALADEKAKLLRIVAFPAGLEVAHRPLPDNIGALSWNAKQDVIAIAKRDGGVWIYSVKEGRDIAHTDTGGLMLSFSPDGSRLAIVVPNQGLRVWEWNRGVEPQIPSGAADVVAAAFSSPEVLLTATKERTVRAVQIPSSIRSGDPFRQIWAAELCPDDKHLAIASDGTLAAVACEDGRVRVWSVPTGVIATDLFYSGKPNALEFTVDGHLLVVGGNSGLHGFLLSSNGLLAEACLRIDRSFNQDEWNRYIGTGRCRAICPDRPGCQ